MKKKNITGLIITIAVFAVVLILSIYFFSNREPVYLQGQVEAKQINVAPKVPGRVKAIYKQEGDQVHKGDLLLELESTELDAKLSQAEAARLAAQAQSDKAQHGSKTHSRTSRFCHLDSHQKQRRLRQENFCYQSLPYPKSKGFKTGYVGIS